MVQQIRKKKKVDTAIVLLYSLKKVSIACTGHSCKNILKHLRRQCKRSLSVSAKTRKI